MFDLPNEALRPEHVPGPDAPWHPTIAEFALTFDGYEAMGNRLSKYAERRFEKWKMDGSLPRDLFHLRACLFMEQRSVRWAFDERPTDDQLAYARALIAAIRIRVQREMTAGPGHNKTGVSIPENKPSELGREQDDAVLDPGITGKPWEHLGSDPAWDPWYTYYAVAGTFVRVRWDEDPPMPTEVCRAENGLWTPDETLWQLCFGENDGWPSEPSLDERTARALAARHAVVLEEPS